MSNDGQRRADKIKARREATIEEANAMLEEAIAEAEADTGQSGDEVWYDLVVATAHLLLLENPDQKGLVREFCRRQIGSIPHDLEQYLGKRDWIDG